MPARRPIVLSAKRRVWRMDDEHAAVMSGALRDRVLERDRYACVFCGLKSSQHQEVHHLDDDHNNNVATNLVTACPLCHQCFHIGLAGMEGGGRMIWLPELEQADLNLLCVVIFVAIFDGGEYAEAAQSLYQSLEERAGLLEASGTLGEGASNPTIWANQLLTLDEDQYANRGVAMEGLRLLPSSRRFSRQIAFWAQTTFASRPPGTWEQIFSAVADKLADEDESEDGDAGASSLEGVSGPAQAASSTDGEVMEFDDQPLAEEPPESIFADDAGAGEAGAGEARA